MFVDCLIKMQHQQVHINNPNSLLVLNITGVTLAIMSASLIMWLTGSFYSVKLGDWLEAYQSVLSWGQAKQGLNDSLAACASLYSIRMAFNIRLSKAGMRKHQRGLNMDFHAHLKLKKEKHARNGFYKIS